MKSIFISIPAYKDSELIPTLRDLFLKSSNQYSIQPHVLLQESEDQLSNRLREVQSEFGNKVNVVPVNVKNSRGPCWARHWLQQFITHQDYYLQLDSHHRFIQDWDRHMIDQLNLCPPKSLLTGYPAPYFPPNEYPPHHVPTKLIGVRFDNDGIIDIEGSVPILNQDKPVEGFLLAGGFILAPIDLCREVPYDPEIYFKGEEVSLAVRVWTNGWNIYHPSRILLYHYYTRVDGTKHWEDDPTWVELDTKSKNRIKTLLGMEHIHPHINMGMFDLGNKRTLEEYQSFSGIDFKNKVIIPKS